MIERSIAEPDRNFILIVPDQFTMQAQMQLIREHPDHAIMNIDALSFGRLTHRVLEETGAEGTPVLDDTGKSLILRHIAGEVSGDLPVLGRNISRIGYVHEIKSAISEFMLYGIGTDDIEEIKKSEGISGQLREKLTELSSMYAAFRAQLGSDYITKEEKMTLLADNISKSEIIRGSVIAFDGFTGFTPLQLRVIGELLKQAGEVKVSLLFDTGKSPDTVCGEQELFHMSSDTMQKLRRLADETGTELLPEVMLEDGAGQGRFKGSPELRHLERNLFRYPYKVYSAQPQSIHLTEAPTVHDEIRQTCMMIRKMIRTTPELRYSDIAVVSGNLSEYADELETVFADSDIPVYMDQARAILLNPFIEGIRSALSIMETDFSQESVMHYLRSGISAADVRDTDIFENHIIRCGIRGYSRYRSPFAPGRGRKAASAAETETADRVRAIMTDELSPLTGCRPETAGGYIRALYSFLEKCDTQNRLAAAADRFEKDGDPVRAREYSQIYRLTIDLLDQFDTLLGSGKMDLKEFTEILEAGFAEIRVGTIPQDVDRVLVGDMERTRLSDVKVLFFIGVNDGNIPSDTSSGGILSDMDREKLAEAGCELAPSPRQQMFIQRLYLYINMTKPSQELFISYALSDSSGKVLRPSYLTGMIKELFPAVTTEYTEKADPYEMPECRADIVQLLASSLRAAAAGGTESAADPAAVLYGEMASRTESSSTAAKLLDIAFYEYRNSKLGEKAARLLYGNEIRGSVSRLEMYAACPYEHYLQYGMGLAERDEYEFRPVDMGTLFHTILELFGNELRQNGMTWADFTPEQGDIIIDRLTEQTAAVYGENILKSSRRSESMILRMRRMLRRTVRVIQRQIRCGSFVPQEYEVRFENARKIVIPGAEDRDMIMTGRIDRIDTCVNNGCLYFRVIDYKSGAKKLGLGDIYNGTQLQLPVYMNEAVQIERSRSRGLDVVPAGMFYYHIDDPVIDSDEGMNEAQEETERMKKLRLSGILCGDGGIAGMMDGSLAAGVSSMVIPAAYLKSGEFNSRSQVYSREDFGAVSRFAENKMISLGSGIASGDISVSPLEDKNRCACDYCAYKSVCLTDTRLPGYSRRKPEVSDETEILDRMKSEAGRQVSF